MTSGDRKTREVVGSSSQRLMISSVYAVPHRLSEGAAPTDTAQALLPTTTPILHASERLVVAHTRTRAACGGWAGGWVGRACGRVASGFVEILPVARTGAPPPPPGRGFCF